MRVTRRQAVVGAAGAVAAGAGLVALADQLAERTDRSAAQPFAGPEQHLLDEVGVIVDNGAEVLVPPLHHRVVTARLQPDTDLDRARSTLEEALQTLESRYPVTPAGLGVTVAWGLPYFTRHVTEAWNRFAPRDRRAGRPALVAGRRFPSDPPDVVLEDNDVAILLRSDSLEHLDDAEGMLVDELDVLAPTSIRTGFVGGGLPHTLAVAAGIPGADLIPPQAELFLGFTSTLRANLGPSRIANHETLGFVSTPGDYFRGGTHMHLSHIFENLEAWYVNFPHADRVRTTFRPDLTVPPGTLTVADETISGPRDVVRGYRVHGQIGHSGALQTASRLTRRHVGPDGTVYAAGTAIPQRADFNTLDNPVRWAADAAVESTPAAGVHFVVFNPSGDDFERVRLAMDGVLPGGRTLAFPPAGQGQGFNPVLRPTRRQNFLVPPRAHRAFPLSELRT